ncbi:heterodisulfide reductase-related iron-sulfur binding cluster [Desulfobacula sp.]|uniref:heterodisulfide reductase-related iron-sulfur binding cluster n=1 Tax=Desulfobacula sp. TaxID=2593537 RepID=UPI0026358A04|nr:heterodisulfide reductase-related iron-sulfur binding cluster [Desulfobacula sp.]
MSLSPEDLILKVFEKCAGKSGCDVCRLHMEEDCLFFPELYRLQDQAEEARLSVCAKDLRHLLDLCTLCGLCPCQDIRMFILQAKAAFIDEKGISLSSRIISDVETVGHWGTTFSTVANQLNRLTSVFPLLKKALNVHPERHLPVFPKESFFLWAKKRGLNSKKGSNSRLASKVAYFVGCSAGYLFPEVGKAAVRILEQNNIEIFVPPQECCSMPLIMEGDKKTALKKIHTNIESLLRSVQNGYDIVCSCPTCGYFFKKLLLENAYYSEAFQEKSGAGNKVMKVPFGSGEKRFITVPKGIYQKLLKDDGYFSSLDPLKRIELSNKVKDMGEYLLSIQVKRKLKIDLTCPDIPMVYYASCHQREQEIGQPYYHLLKSFPDSDIIQIKGVMQCCGMGGHLGYKTSFHPHTLKIGEPLFERLLSEKDRTIITDCLSCRIQFQQTMSRKVFHPLEMF